MKIGLNETVTKIRLNKDFLLTGLLAVYFCSTPINSALTVIVGSDIANIIVNIILFFFIFICGINNRIRNSAHIFFVYACITIIILTTVVIHPEYEFWYNHELYGFSRQFLNLRGGIWALLIISFYKDEEKLLKDLKIVASLVFLAYFGKFVAAMYRGYWIINVNGVDSIASYDMEFGFRILFSIALWGAIAFLNGNNNKKYLMLYLFGSLIILLGGSRAPFIWAVFIGILTIPFKYRNLEKRQKKILCFCAFLLLPVTIFLLLNADYISLMLGKTLISFGVSSRTVISLAEGSFLESNGRSIIYTMAIELIMKGGLFGHGFYGDRYYIGERFRWGYSHDVFLELLVSFGVIGGTILIIALIKGIVNLYKKSTDYTRQIIFITFLGASLKLIFSSSFWYEPTFWALIALMIVWKKPKQELT